MNTSNGTLTEHATTSLFDAVRQEIEPLRLELVHHPVYARLSNPESLRTFMEYHVFAVWDFMSLLKALQRQFCCVNVPWVPSGSVNSRLINEIVLAEESDEDGKGGNASHFELYLRSMDEFGADTSMIRRFLADLRSGAKVPDALKNCNAPSAVKQFVAYTFEVIESGDPRRIVAAFTFGREDLLPDVFSQIVRELNGRDGARLDTFEYYLRRHIELDGGEHGPMAARLVESVCEKGMREKSFLAAEAIRCLEARLELWNGIGSEVENGFSECRN